MGYLGGSFKAMAYFSAGVFLLGQGSFQGGEVDIASILLRADVAVSKGLTVNYSFLSVFGMTADFVDVNM